MKAIRSILKEPHLVIPSGTDSTETRIHRENHLKAAREEFVEIENLLEVIRARKSYLIENAYGGELITIFNRIVNRR